MEYTDTQKIVIEVLEREASRLELRAKRVREAIAEMAGRRLPGRPKGSGKHPVDLPSAAPQGLTGTGLTGLPFDPPYKPTGSDI